MSDKIEIDGKEYIEFKEHPKRPNKYIKVTMITNRRLHEVAGFLFVVGLVVSLISVGYLSLISVGYLIGYTAPQPIPIAYPVMPINSNSITSIPYSSYTSIIYPNNNATMILFALAMAIVGFLMIVFGAYLYSEVEKSKEYEIPE